MELRAIYRIKGVKKVIRGKGVNGTTAHPGDIFEPHSDKSGKSLIDGGSAIRSNEELPDNGLKDSGPTITNLPANAEGGETLDSIAPREPVAPVVPQVPVKSAAKPTKAAAKKAADEAAKKAAAEKPADSNDGLDDLGLDDGSDTADE